MLALVVLISLFWLATLASYAGFSGAYQLILTNTMP
jgi:hypothetical protein